MAVGFSQQRTTSYGLDYRFALPATPLREVKRCPCHA